MFARRENRLTICGIDVPCDTDFRLMCRYSAAAVTKKSCALQDIAEHFFYAGLPDGVTAQAAAEALNDFYAKGFAPKADRSAVTGKTPQPCFDFEADEAYFVAAYLSVYGIDLHSAKLHWFTFCELFRGLPDDCKLKQIMGIRATDISELSSNAEKNRIRRLQSIFSLGERKPRYKTVAERDAAMLADMKRRSEEVHKE